MKTAEEQIEDAEYYLGSAKKNRFIRPDHVDKAMSILLDLQKNMRSSSPAAKTTKRKHVTLVVGHEPGGGTTGERKYNTKVAKLMKDYLKESGIESTIYYHTTRNWVQRCSELKARTKNNGSDFMLLLHYNAYSDPSANGHEFHYRAAEFEAGVFRDEWQKQFPSSRPRQNNGTLRNLSGRGSRMIRMAPFRCVLTEGFFISNPQERKKHKNNPYLVAEVFTRSIIKILK